MRNNRKSLASVVLGSALMSSSVFAAGGSCGSNSCGTKKADKNVKPNVEEEKMQDASCGGEMKEKAQKAKKMMEGSCGATDKATTKKKMMEGSCGTNSCGAK